MVHLYDSAAIFDKDLTIKLLVWLMTVNEYLKILKKISTSRCCVLQQTLSCILNITSGTRQSSLTIFHEAWTIIAILCINDMPTFCTDKKGLPQRASWTSSLVSLNLKKNKNSQFKHSLIIMYLVFEIPSPCLSTLQITSYLSSTQDLRCRNKENVIFF